MRILLVAGLACACTSTQARKVQHITELTLAGSLSGMLASLATAYVWPGENPVLLDIGLGFVPLALGSALIYVAADGMSTNPEPAPLTERERERQTAWDLAREAKHAARAGDCVQVQAIEPRVRDLDQDIYRRFLHDKIIQTCLAPEPDH